MSKDIPIIFSGPMVRALLDGRKTQTRRLAWGKSRPMPKAMPRGNLKMSIPGFKVNGGTYSPASPWQKVKPGDRLWARENWHAAHGSDDIKPRDIVPGPRSICPAATYSYADTGIVGKLRPAIHMPRWASRLTLVVTATKIERLNEISGQDARAEGISMADWPKGLSDPCEYDRVSINRFRELWISLHGADSWDGREVVALNFKVIKQNIDTLATQEAA